jgi:ribosomal-protein-alanine N-acetyltransferase
VLRAATRDDLTAVAEIQRSAPEASQWSTADYLDHDCTVVTEDGRVLAFLVTRQTAPGEREILNVAVEPAQRGRGLARRLLEQELARSRGEWFLEVRESNVAARRLYESLGFREVGRRENYYQAPPEQAIVMRFFS